MIKSAYLKEEHVVCFLNDNGNGFECTYKSYAGVVRGFTVSYCRLTDIVEVKVPAGLELRLFQQTISEAKNEH